MMDTQVERIRERVADEYWQAMDEAMHTAHGRQDGMFFDMALADLRTLLRIIDQQRDVIAAAGEVVRDVTEANWYEDANTYLVDAEKLETLRREYDALTAGDGG